MARGQDGVEVKSMIELVLVKRDIMQYVQDVRTVGGMGLSLSDHHVRLVGICIKRREVVVEVRKIRSEKLKEYQYTENDMLGLLRRGK